MPTYDPTELELRRWAREKTEELSREAAMALHPSSKGRLNLSIGLQGERLFPDPEPWTRDYTGWDRELNPMARCQRHDHWHDTWRKDEVEELE